MLLLHVSDTHLGSSKPFTGSFDREKDFYEVFDEAIDIAIKEHVDAVIHSGDLFDDFRPPPRPYVYAVKALNKLRERNIKFIVVAGQHDMAKRAGASPIHVLKELGLAYSLGESPGDVKNEVVKLNSGDLGVTGIPYFEGSMAKEVLSKVKPPEVRKKILIAHILLQELGLPSYHISITQLPVKEYNYVALGDYHINYVYPNIRNPPIVYPGSTEAQDIQEYRDERYVVLVDLSGSEAVLQHIRLERFRRFAKLVIKNVNELQQSLGKLGSHNLVKKPILYVELTSKLSRFEAEKLRTELSRAVERGLIFDFRILAKTAEGGELEVGESRGEGVSTVSLDAVIKETFKDEGITQLVQALVSSTSDKDVELILELLVKDRSLYKKLEELVRRK